MWFTGTCLTMCSFGDISMSIMDEFSSSVTLQCSAMNVISQGNLRLLSTANYIQIFIIIQFSSEEEY